REAEVVELTADLAAELEDVAKPLCRDESYAGTLPLDDCVRCHSRSVCEAADVLTPDIPLTRELLQCRGYGLARMCPLRWHLEDGGSVSSDRDDVGECATDVDADMGALGRRHALSRSPAPQNSSCRSAHHGAGDRE